MLSTFVLWNDASMDTIYKYCYTDEADIKQLDSSDIILIIHSVRNF